MSKLISARGMISKQINKQGMVHRNESEAGGFVREQWGLCNQ